MLVTSDERSTGMGAIRYTAIAVGKEWITVSNMPNRLFHGRLAGVYSYSVQVPDTTITARFYRSNSRKETVWINKPSYPEIVFLSFDDADWWLEKEETDVHEDD